MGTSPRGSGRRHRSGDTSPGRTPWALDENAAPPAVTDGAGKLADVARSCMQQTELRIELEQNLHLREPDGRPITAWLPTKRTNVRLKGEGGSRCMTRRSSFGSRVTPNIGAAALVNFRADVSKSSPLKECSNG